MTEEQKEDLYDYLFHYNSYKKIWCCFHRKETKDYFLSSFKSPTNSNIVYRKRISFRQLKWIIKKHDNTLDNHF